MTEARSSSDTLDQHEVVVVAEDDVDLRETYRIWLAEHWDVEIAEDGHQVLSTVDESTTGVLLDRQMPGRSGPEVAERLADTAFDGFVVVVSAYKPDDHLDETDVDDYLVKPISKPDLLDALDDLAD